MRTLLLSLALIVCQQSALATLPGEAAFHRGDYSTARKELADAPGFGSSSELMIMQARIEIAENNLDDAQELIDTVIKADTKSALAHALLGQLHGMQASRASLFKAGRYAKKSLAAFETALELDPELEEALVGMVRYRHSAPALFGGSIDKAIETAHSLEDINPVAGGLELATIYGKQKEQDKQIATLEKIAKDHPNDPRASLALGFIEQSARNYEQASVYFDAAVSSARDTSEHTYTLQGARYQLGRTVVLSGSENEDDLNRGIEALTRYLAGPRFGDLPAIEWAHYRRGLLYERHSGKKSEAEQDFAKAADSDDRDWQRALGAR